MLAALPDLLLLGCARRGEHGKMGLHHQIGLGVGDGRSANPPTEEEIEGGVEHRDLVGSGDHQGPEPGADIPDLL